VAVLLISSRKLEELGVTCHFITLHSFHRISMPCGIEGA
jgi:hypothetical protein